MPFSVDKFLKDFVSDYNVPGLDPTKSNASSSYGFSSKPVDYTASIEKGFESLSNAFTSALKKDYDREQAVIQADRAFNAHQAQLQRDWQDAYYERSLADSIASAKQAMDFSKSEREAAQAWQEMMSNSSYQRAVKDMKKAGINPILAYAQGGASTPGSTGAHGVTYSGSSASGASASSASKVSSKRTELYQMITSLLETQMKNFTSKDIASMQNLTNIVSKLIPW